MCILNTSTYKISVYIIVVLSEKSNEILQILKKSQKTRVKALHFLAFAVKLFRILEESSLMATISYGRTKTACYLGYITQAIAVNFLPLLYVTFQNEFSVTLAQLGLLPIVLFVVQIVVDLLAARFGRHLSYRTGCVAAHICSTAGLVSMSFLPSLLPNPYVGVLISAFLLSVGGGLIEVLISPVIDAIPGEGKAGEMSMLHSFYCWGVVGVALLSTAFFAAFGTIAWRSLTLLWAIIPALTAILFAIVPLPAKPEELLEEKQSFSFMMSGLFWLFLALMLCSGATELGLAQWASLFAERGLQVSKSLGDLLGPCAFAFCQGLSRVVYARLSRSHNACGLLALSAVGCVAGYGLIVLSPWPLVSLLGFCLSGWFVGPMWPGILSLTSAHFPTGGTTMFALLALCGDVGCSLAPAMVGGISEMWQLHMPLASALRGGFGVCTLFPFLLAIGLLLLRKQKKND